MTKGDQRRTAAPLVVADELCELMGFFGGDSLAFKDPSMSPTVILMAGHRASVKQLLVASLLST